MIVLGVQRGHDAGICLMKDGRILCVVEAERVHKIKHADGPGTIPEAARIGFEHAGVDPADVDGIVIADSFRDRVEFALPRLCGDMHSSKLLAAVGCCKALNEISDLGISGIPADTPVLAACHHACHAAGAAYMSGYKNALVYVYDGWGVCAATVAYSYRDGELLRIGSSVDKIGIGWRYELLAHFAVEINSSNTKRYDYAGKLMGLASIAKPDPAAVPHLKSWLRMDYDDYKSSWDEADKIWFPGLVNDEGFVRNSTSVCDPGFQTLLASLQEAMNQVVCEEVTELSREIGTCDVILAGGCALNIITNDATERLDWVNRLFVPPNANDGGLAMGAAVIGSAYGLESPLHFPNVPLERKRNPFKGPNLIGKPRQGSTDNASSATQRAALDRVVAALGSGGVVGFVQGRMEIGPRALGHRSLLADATHPDMRAIIGSKIKQREWWRPFAPVARSIDAEEYFEIRQLCPYMLRTVLVRESWREKLKPIVHYDNTARLQVLESEASDPALWYVLSELKRLRGVGVCLNTSMNLSGNPIVNSYSEIYYFLESTGVDFVYVDGELLERS